MPERGKCFSKGLVTLYGAVAVKDKRLAAAAKDLVVVSGEQKGK